ncbi:MAG: tRNA guanosine(34) transglycosylase Tgt [Candidatus Vogelbacteria bacterium]|nr:tRNA guanosine(34) transglycosylase Tgt [Candidatus Vogelbacteria bacterium]
MKSAIQFKIEKRLAGRLGRAGVLTTAHGVIETPAFVTVGTQATIKSVMPEQVASLGAQIILANTYHLYLQPGVELVKQAGGLGKFMNWPGPTMTDSGGFQVFSLGAAFGRGGVSKVIASPENFHQGSTLGQVLKVEPLEPDENSPASLAKIDDDGVTFRSHLDGSEHRLTPEKSIQIQHDIGADIMFAFDECTSPLAPFDYQKEAMARTHRWAERSLLQHRMLKLQHPMLQGQGLFGIVQGGRHEDLRKASAEFIGNLGFDGFGIGGSFTKEDIGTAVKWVNEILPEAKPRHLLGIGEPADMIAAVENGCDLFDCVVPTRMARNGTLMIHPAAGGARGRINILNVQYRTDFSPIEPNCACHTCSHYTRAYLAHLFRAKEMLAATLASIHNLYFTINLVNQMRQAILEDTFSKLKNEYF